MGEMEDTSVIAPVKDQVAADLHEGVTILQLKSGVYYELDLVGATVWRLIQESPRQVQEVHQVLLKEYDVSPEQCRNDLFHLLENLLEEKLIEVQANASS